MVIFPVVVIVGVIAYLWASRGFFSAFLHMLCVIAAGTIAFAVWEPLAFLIMGADNSRTGWMIDLAWTTALLVPFALVLAILRLTLDKLLPANVDLDGVTNLVGGGVCGLVSGVLAAGIILIGASYLRIGTSLIGYSTVRFESNGSIVRENSAFLPPVVDRVTAAFFSSLSNTTFRTLSGDSLARWRPDLADAGHAVRVTFPPPDGGGRQSVRLDAIEVLSHYSFAPKDPKDLTRDSFDPDRPQNYVYLDRTSLSPGQTTLEGFVVRFKAGAKEKSGRIVVGNSQVRLIAHSEQEGDSMSIYPIAVISQAAGDKPALGRWRFDGPNVFIASVGGRDDAPMAFEFPVPRGYQPIGLEVKGTRFDVSRMQATPKFDSLAARDGAIRSGTIASGASLGELDDSRAVTYRLDPNNFESHIRVSDGIFSGLVIQKDNRKELEILEEPRALYIINGSAKFSINELQRNIGVDQKLQVRRFAATEDTAIVQVIFDIRNNEFGYLSNAAAGMDRSQAPLLIDHNNTPYSPLGYMYRDSGEIWIHFTPQSPVSAVSDLPTLTRSRPDQQLILLYRVSKNVKVDRFTVGKQVIANFKPALETPQ